MAGFKGWNEYVLYGEDFNSALLDLKNQPFYYLYTGMTWDDGEEGVITADGDGKGLFIQNFEDNSVEGWYCIRNSEALYNWDCRSARIDSYFFEPDQITFPM